MKRAFVASGGGLKAYAFHVGVMRALEEHGFRRRLAAPVTSIAGGEEISCFIGSSAGACFSAAATYFDSLDDAEGVIGLKPTRRPRFSRRVLFRPNLSLLWDRSGLFRATGVQKYFEEIAPAVSADDFRKIAPEVFVCATQLNSSRKVVFGPLDSSKNGAYDPFIAYYNDVSISKAIAASVAVPGIFRPYSIVNAKSGETFEYIDGEIRETLSVHIARDVGVDLVIVSNIWMPYHYDAELGSLSRMGLGRVLSQAITQIIEQKVDRFRNEHDRHAEAIEAIRDLGRAEKLDERVIRALIARVSEILRYRKMQQLYIAPSRGDTKFLLAPSWSFDSRHLGYARDFGYQKATEALAHWKKQNPQPRAVPAA